MVLGMYSSRNLRDICERAIPEISDMRWLKPGDSVFVKVACNSPRPHPAVTDPNAVEALVGFLRDRGAGTIYVGDQAGVEHVRLRSDGSRKSFTCSVMRKNGLLNAIERSGAILHCFDDQGWDGYFQPELDFDNNWYGHLWLAKIIREVDHIVYLPRLGAHAIAGYTCAIKNAVGWLRDDSRLYLHQRGPSFHEKIAEINHVKEIRERLRFSLTLGEAALVNVGPDYGERYDFDGSMALGSASLVDHDRLASALLPWLNAQNKSVFDVFDYRRHADLLNRCVVLINWGVGAMAGYYPVVPFPLGRGLAPCVLRLAWLQRYRLGRITVHGQGSRISILPFSEFMNC